MASLYIHIPFCRSRCIYCDFYSTTRQEALHTAYIDAVQRELAMRQDYLHDKDIKTIYIGGGTPSSLPAVWLERLISSLPTSHVTEFTVECNPDDITQEMAQRLTALGVNRISMGVQTFSDSRLRFLRRRHNAAAIPAAVNMLRKAGIGNISIDLMFGFPEETLADWQQDIDQALSLETEHISAYSLMYEDGTTLTNMLNEGRIKATDEETSREMYYTLTDRLTAAGYEHYEISNFCRQGRRSQHNSNYWNGTEYLGLGAAAHSYNTTTRQWNVSNLQEYIRCINTGKLPCESEEIDSDTRYNDLITTALRTCEGILLSTLSEEHRNYLLANAAKHLNNNTLRIDDDRIHLTRNGLYVSNDIMADLIFV